MKQLIPLLLVLVLVNCEAQSDNSKDKASQSAQSDVAEGMMQDDAVASERVSDESSEMMDMDDSMASDVASEMMDMADSMASDDKMKDFSNDVGYALGVFMVQQGGLSELLPHVEVDNMIQGFKDALSGEIKVDQEMLSKTIQDFIKTQQEKQDSDSMTKLEALKKEQEQNLAAGKTYLDEKKALQNVLELESGTLVEIVTSNPEGASPTVDSTVSVHYTGTFVDGTTFDSSRDRGQPAQFPLNGVIAGFRDGIGAMKVGERAYLYIPADSAYGLLTGDDEQDMVAVQSNQYAVIGPGNTLIFDVELLEIVEDPQ